MHVQRTTIFRVRSSEYKRWLLFYSIILSIASVNCRNCFTFPVSLSTFEFCNNGTCYFTQQVAVSIPIAYGASACLELVPPDGVSDPIDTEFTIGDSHFIYNVDYFYHADDPKLDIKTFCGCPSGSPATCQNCGAGTPSGDYISCVSGTHSAKDCFLKGSGNWCAKIGFSGRNRYRIYKILPTVGYNIDVAMLISDPLSNITTQTSFNYNGFPRYYGNETQVVNVTILSDTGKPSIMGFDYAVVDLYDPSDFYILSSADVNSILTFDMSKFGWFKSDINPSINSANVASQTTATFKDDFACLDDKIDLIQNYLHHANYLSNNINKLASRVAPGSFLLDTELTPNFSEQGFTPMHAITPYYYINEGWIFTANGITVFIGFDSDGTMTPMPSDFSFLPGQPVLTQNGIINNTNTWAVAPVAIYLPRVGIDTFDYQILNFIKQGVNYGFCSDFIKNNATGTFTTRTCINITFKANDFPSFKPTTYTFDGTFRTVSLPKATALSKAIYSNLTNGVLNMLIEFKNFSVKFDVTSAKPLLNSLTCDNIGKCVLNVQSVTVGGSCYVFSTPATLVVSQPIDITVTPRDIKLSLSASAFKGIATFGVQCYKNIATIDVTIDYDNTPKPPIIVNPVVNPADSPGVIIDWMDKSGKSIWDALTSLWKGPGIIDHIMGAIWWVVIVISALIVIFVLYKVITLLCICRKATSWKPKWFRAKTGFNLNDTKKMN